MTETRHGFTFFFRPESPFSQWYPSSFVVDGVTYACAEQFMMASKARLFGDDETAQAILAATTPREHKALGRQVKNFDEATWLRERERIVYTGSRAKYTQSPELRALLLATAGTRLVEASPYDRVWGIGLDASDPAATDPSRWRGLNLLGEVLTRLREELLSEPR
jgi:ribA/ribD-fused uncharacterized protein